MFEWSRGSSLKAMMNAAIPGVEADDWLEGWMFGFMQSRFKLSPPLDVLDVELAEKTRDLIIAGIDSRFRQIRSRIAEVLGQTDIKERLDSKR